LAIEIKDYETPEFLLTETTDTIYNRMTEVDVGAGRKAKDVLDVSQGSMFWDACRPAAIEKASLVQFQLNEVIKAGVPQYALDEDLDRHGAADGVIRKPAAPAEVDLTVTGTQGTYIPAGFRFATPTIGDVPGSEFATTEEATIPESGTILVHARAVEAGSIGNVQAGSISLQSESKDGITSVNNAEDASGGTDIESNEEYQQRILEKRQKNPGSGSKYDYVRWAKEVAGVKDAYCIPEWLGKGTGTVKVLCLGTDGLPAGSVVLQRVRDYITGPNGDDGLAPTDAIVTVDAPLALYINYYATLILKSDADIDTVILDFKTDVLKYYVRAREEKIIRFNLIKSIFTDIAGVTDYQTVEVRIRDTVASYNPETGYMVLTNGHPEIQTGDLIRIDSIDYTIASYTASNKTVEITDGPASIINNTVAVRLGDGQENINLPLDYYPITGDVAITVIT
jgi:uncharacterized phage protein gp47/JayE